mmetsp:Transcript_1106/g.3379  ORF Transcript_1106/g.3379 Transcript_1106/m.3379 type:complete len:274 (+) Transcript_1106:173-994(+)
MRREVEAHLRNVLGIAQDNVIDAGISAVEVHRFEMQRVEVVSCLDRMGRQVIPKSVPRGPVLGFYSEDPRRVVRPLLHTPQAGDAGKVPAVPGCDLASVPHDLRQRLHLRAHEGSPEAVHLRVRGRLEVQEVVCRVEAVVDQGLQPVVVPLFAGVDPAPVARSDGLVGVERGDGEVPEGANESAVVSPCPHGLADVLHKPPAPLLAEGLDLHDVLARDAVGVADDDCLGARRDLLEELCLAGVQRARRAVAVDGLSADHFHHVRHSNHGERRH